MTIVIAMAGIILFIAALLLVIRMTIGPTILDRSVALDVLVAVTAGSLGLYTAHTGVTHALPVLVVLAGCGFVGAVSVARYAGQSEDRGGGNDDQRVGGAR